MAGYYNPGDAGGNVFVAPRKSLNRSAAHQMVPPAIQTRVDRTVDHLSSWQLFEDKGLGNPGTPSMPDSLARSSGIDPLRIKAGDLSRESAGAVHKAVKNLEYTHRMSDPNVRSVDTEQSLRAYSSVASPTSPAQPTPGPGAIFHKNSLERLAGRSMMPTEGYTPGLGPQAFIDKRTLLSPSSGLSAQNADALAQTMRAMPKGTESTTYIPQKATNAMTLTRDAGIPENRNTVTRYAPTPAGIQNDGSGNAAYLSQTIQRKIEEINLPRSQPAQVHPSRQNYSFSDGQMRGLAGEGEIGARTYDWKKIGTIGGLAALGALGIFLATRR